MLYYAFTKFTLAALCNKIETVKQYSMMDKIATIIVNYRVISYYRATS